MTNETKGVASEKNSIQALQRELAYEDTLNCVQCGYCLPVCPTYETRGKETHSPRGRINLVKMMSEGKLTDWTLLADTMDKCLGCRACETACPSGVRYGNILESARHAIVQRSPYTGSLQAGRELMLRRVVLNKRLLSSISGLLWIYQKSGLERGVNRLKLHRVLPKPLAAIAAALPPQTSPLARIRRRKRYMPERHGVPRFRVAFFTGCVMDALFERINRLGMELLAAGGCEVVAIPGETCCGALHSHAGDRSAAIELAKRNIEAIEQLSERAGGVDWIVNTAGGCGAMLTEYPHLFREDPVWLERAMKFVKRSKDISEVLNQLELPFLSGAATEQPSMITYQPSCHMTHVQKVRSAPIALMKAIPGVELQEMVDKDKCCGSAGIYNLVQYDESMEILDLKMTAVKDTKARTIVTTNPGCLLQMQTGIQREGLQGQVRAVHLVELLAEACGLE